MTLIYFHVWDGHFKMWGYQAYKNKDTGNYRLVTYHGRIAETLDKLRQIEKNFDGNNDAPFFDCYDYVKSKISGKLCKGYVPVPNHIYTKYSMGEMSLSKFIAEVEKVKAEQIDYEPNVMCEVA